MSVLNKIAFYQNRRDEVPNQELARELAATKDRGGVSEIAEKTLPAVNAGNKAEFIQVLENRWEDLTASQTTRLKKVIKTAQMREGRPTFR